MAGEWPLVTIAECAADEPYATQIGPFGEKIRAEMYTSEGAPVLRGTNVNTDERFRDSDFVFIDLEVAEREFGKFVCETDDVILCHKGTLGKIGIIPKRTRFQKYIMGNSMLKVRCDKRKLEPLYLYYWLTSRKGQEYLFSRVSQVGVPQIQRPLTTLREATLPLPPLPEQRAIAHILGTLDDKIELNRRMNETLEAIARALFKSWFVNFDPVRAKAAGKDPGLPKHIADLFPDSFENSELGEIPKGWRVGVLGDVADHPRRGVQPDEIEPATPYIALEHMPRCCIALAEWGTADGLESNKFEFKKGEILFGKLRPYFHKVGVAPVDGVCSTDIVVVTPRSQNWFGFVLGHVSSDAFVEYTNAGSTGTKMPRTSWADMARYAVVIPPETIARAFASQVYDLVSRIRASIYESRTLAALRATLLPNLISGELRLGSASLRHKETAAC